jgi:hypothetical protein
MHVARVFFKCFRCFIHTLQLFQVFQVFHTYVASVSDVCFECVFKCLRCMWQVFFNCFERMLQVFYLDVANVDLVLQRDPLAATVRCSCLGVVHARGKQRRMETGARVVLAM